MSTRTTNFNLYKPDATDKFEDFRSEHNANMDIIDQNLGGGGSKHTIEDSDGTAMTARSNLQFVDLSVTDDSVNNATVVSASGKADKTDLTELLETSPTASHTLSEGTYFYLDGKLCYAIADINIGDTFYFLGNYRRLTGTGLFGALNHIRNLFNDKADKSDVTSIFQTGSVADQAIGFGQKFYLDGILHRAIANIANGASFSSSNCEQTNLNVIGEFVTGTSITTTVPTASATNVMSMTLSRGVWVITAGGGYSTSFTQAAYIELFHGTSRYYGTRAYGGTTNSGQNLNTSVVTKVTSSSETIYLKMYQASGSDKTTQYVNLSAVRIA